MDLVAFDLRAIVIVKAGESLCFSGKKLTIDRAEKIKMIGEDLNENWKNFEVRKFLQKEFLRLISMKALFKSQKFW